VNVPLRLITEGWSVTQIHEDANSEFQRAAIERMGWLEYIDQAGLSLLSSVPDPGNQPHELALYERGPDGLRNARILVMTNGSPDRSGAIRRYAEPVPADFSDPVAAAAWQYDVPVATYRQLRRRT
jgi:hypothetical protein